MSPAERSALLRQRFKTLYPAASSRVIARGGARAKVTPLEPAKKPRKPQWRDFPAECSPRAKHQAKFVTLPDEPKPETVRVRHRHGPAALTLISEQLKRPEKEREKVMLTPEMA